MYIKYKLEQNNSLCKSDIHDAVNGFLEQEKIFPDVIYFPNHTMSDFARMHADMGFARMINGELKLMLLTSAGILPIELIKDHIYKSTDDKFIKVANEEVEKAISSILLGNEEL